MVSIEVDQIIWVGHSDQPANFKYWQKRRFAHFNARGECCCWYGNESNTSLTNEPDDVREWTYYSLTQPVDKLTTLSTNYDVWYA